MASKAVVDAVAARLTANWTACAFFDPNTVGDPPKDGSPFLEVQYPVATGEQITIGAPGNNVYREAGAIRFVLHVERGQGVGEGLGWADALAALFRGRQFDHVTTFAPSSPVLDDGNDRGAYTRLSFAVEYFTDVVG